MAVEAKVEWNSHKYHWPETSILTSIEAGATAYRYLRHSAFTEGSDVLVGSKPAKLSHRQSNRYISFLSLSQNVGRRLNQS